MMLLWIRKRIDRPTVVWVAIVVAYTLFAAWIAASVSA